MRNTRTQGVLRKIDLQVYKNKLGYRHAWSAILSLKGHGKWEKELKVLEDDDVRGLSERALSQEERAQEEARRERGFIDEVAQGNTVQLPSMGKAIELFLGSGTTKWCHPQTPFLKMVCSSILYCFLHSDSIGSGAGGICKSKGLK